jgi:hypothetical protein
MSSVLALNLILMAIVLVAIVGMHHWALRTQHHDPHFVTGTDRRRGHDRRQDRATTAQTAAERRRAERRAGRTVTA